jgi:outer membrane protein
LFGELTNNGLSGPVNPIYDGSGTGSAPSVCGGGYGNLLGQIFRRNYPNYSIGFSLNIPLRNRAAQADYVTDLLQLRQAKLELQRERNQMTVDVKNAVVSLQQARRRYQTAASKRKLAEDNLTAQQNLFKYGAVTDTTQLIAAQRDLADEQGSELQAMANYTHARIAFDEALGTTLETFHISAREVTSGEMGTVSRLPVSVIGGEER